MTWVELSRFHALRPGTARVGDEEWAVTVHDLGLLRLRSGRLEANDPFINLGDGVVVDAPPGDHPVRVTVADVSDEQDGGHLREAYLSVVLREGVAVSVEMAADDGVAVDAATVGFVDHDAVGPSMPDPETWYDTVFDDETASSWFSLMDDPDHLIEGCANVVMPEAADGQNVVLAHSGWGDGYFPVVQTLDADGVVLAIHIDLLVILDEPEEPDEAPARRGLLRRLLGR